MINLLIILSLLLFIHYVWFLRNVYRGLQALPEQNKNTNNYFPSVSVIIPFRNEENNLPVLVESLKKLDYYKNKIEFILVDDYSNDNSLQWLKEQPLDFRFKIIKKFAGKNPEGKKNSIELGITHARGEIIFITDADCIPPSNWIKSTLPLFDENTGFVAGPVLFNSNGSTFQNMQQIEFAGLIIAAAGLIGKNQPTTCSAANIAFRKNVFFLVDGYKDNLKFSSGDDEFLMRKIFSLTNFSIKFNTSPQSIVITKPNNNAVEFFNQRKRWASKSLFYENKFLILKLFLVFLFFLSIPLLLIYGSLGNLIILLTGLLLLLLKILVDFLILKKGAKILFENYKFKSFLLAELFHIPYILISALTGTIGNFEWKNRKLKR